MLTAKPPNKIDICIDAGKRIFSGLKAAAYTAYDVAKGDKKLEIRELTPEERANRMGNLDQLDDAELKALQASIHRRLNDRKK